VTLKAPFDANVAEISVSPGQALAPGGQAADGQSTDGRIPAIRLVAAGVTSITADATEADVGQLKRGESMDLSFPGLPGQALSGTIVEVASTAVVKDNQVTYPVRIDVQRAPPNLKFGMTAQASLSLAEARNVLTAPRRAIRSVSGQTVVDRVDADGQVQSAPVKVGRTYGANVEILEGVQEGDVVAVYEGVVTTSNIRQ
jgi:HlyD family secretion protein